MKQKESSFCYLSIMLQKLTFSPVLLEQNGAAVVEYNVSVFITRGVFYADRKKGYR